MAVYFLEIICGVDKTWNRWSDRLSLRDRRGAMSDRFTALMVYTDLLISSGHPCGIQISFSGLLMLNYVYHTRKREERMILSVLG